MGERQRLSNRLSDKPRRLACKNIVQCCNSWKVPWTYSPPGAPPLLCIYQSKFLIDSRTSPNSNCQEVTINLLNLESMSKHSFEGLFGCSKLLAVALFSVIRLVGEHESKCDFLSHSFHLFMMKQFYSRSTYWLFPQLFAISLSYLSRCIRFITRTELQCQWELENSGKNSSVNFVVFFFFFFFFWMAAFLS